VILMSALDTIEERVFGLEHGADDYLVKPFALAELLARVRVRLRVREAGGALQRRVGDLALDLASRLVRRGAEEIALTPREFELLLYLVQHENALVTRNMLARDVWRVVRPPASLANVIDVHVANLRRKLDDGRAAKLIHTVRGQGFMLGLNRPEDG
jgi:DNA-binding response OmpR family regulator